MIKVRPVIAPSDPLPAAASWSPALRIGEELIVSGVHARQANGMMPADAAAQFDAALDKLEALIFAEGGTRDNVVKLTVYLSDIADKDAVNAVRARRFGPIYPCSTLLAVSGFAFPELKVEVDAIVRLDATLNGG
ncbi:RidA family protein [Sphingomonas sp. IC081]|uniref:RidA family protein n=1 Tax=Sphingomonas sp. IC081 TaxID=304378 RepID=UPI0021AE90B2|nr:RidA family protein [Sphingomonas sp. IC081]